MSSAYDTLHQMLLVALVVFSGHMAFALPVWTILAVRCAQQERER